MNFNDTSRRIGMVMGTFIVSGLFHNLLMYAMGQGTSVDVVAFSLLKDALLF